MTVKSYLEHTEPIFTELKILNLYKLNFLIEQIDILIYKTVQKFLLTIF